MAKHSQTWPKMGHHEPWDGRLNDLRPILDWVMTGTALLSLFALQLPCELLAHVWLCVAMCARVWPCLAMCGYVWLCVAVCGYVWLCMAWLYGDLLTMVGYVWLCVAIQVNYSTTNE